MDFSEILYAAKHMDNEAFNQILEEYWSILRCCSICYGEFDEDLWQEQCLLLWKCIMSFEIQ